MFAIGIAGHELANQAIKLSMWSQGIHGFKRWPWSEDDLWMREHPTNNRGVEK